MQASASRARRLGHVASQRASALARSYATSKPPPKASVPPTAGAGEKYAAGAAPAAQAAKSSGGGAGKLLLLAAVVAPPAYVAYMTRQDGDFRRDFEKSAPEVYRMVSPYLIEDNSSEEGAHGGEFEGLHIHSLKKELEELETKLADTVSSSVTFTKEEVNQLKKDVQDKIAELQKAREEHDKKQKEAKGAQEQEQDASKKVDAEVVEKDASAGDSAETEVAKTAEELEVKEEEPAIVEIEVIAVEDENAEEQKEDNSRQKSAEARNKLDAIKSRARGLKAKADASAAEQIQEMEKELRKDLEVVLAHDLGNLDEEGLRRRVVQLVLELKDRNRWEAMRMYELTKQHNEDMVKKYDDLLRDQADRYEEIMRMEVAEVALRTEEDAEVRAEDHFNRVLFNKEQQWHRQTQEALERQRVELAREMEHKFVQAKSQLEAKASEDIAARVQALDGLKAKVQNLQAALQHRSDNEISAKNLREMSLAMLEVQDALYKRPQEVGSALQKLRKAASGDASIDAALSTISPRIMRKGVAGEIDLLQRFDSVFDECYKVALVPDEDAGIVEYAVARAVAALTFRKGDSPKASESQEFHLTQARNLLQNKHDLAATVREMDHLQGLVKNTASDWVSEAKDRVAVEQALILVKSHLSVLSASLAK